MMPTALRKGMPKGRDLSDPSRSGLIDLAALLNNRPRRTPGRRTPADAMAVEIAGFRSSVATENRIQANPKATEPPMPKHAPAPGNRQTRQQFKLSFR
jgi:hypothetical protein